LFETTYVDKKSDKNKWMFASRRKEPVASTGDRKADAVMVVPIWENDEGFYRVVILRQFRPPTGDYLYEFPAGLVDAGETCQEAARRELKEETGLTLEWVKRAVPPCYTSAGMSDESVSICFVFCSGEISTKGNESDEDIEVVVLRPGLDIEEFMRDPKVKFDMKTYLCLMLLMVDDGLWKGLV
jgi:ADP-ribose pyrophosphatase